MRTKLSLSLVVIVLLLTTVSGANARFGATAPTAPQAAVGTGFTFQGQLKNAGATVNGNCDMTFRLYDAAVTGVQIGSTITTTVPVSNSLFTVMLNTNGEYGATAFNGDARWLEVNAKCVGDVAFTTLTPRQPITAAPYAISAGTAMTATFSVQADLLDGLHATAFQSRVSGHCAVGSAIRVVNADGTVTCTPTGTLDYFQGSTSITTTGAFDSEFFTIGSDTYLAVANYHNGSTYNLDSKLYRWSGSQFVEFQSIPTQGASDWEFFTIGGDAYLAVANAYNGSTYNLDSKLYRWNGTQFVEFQSIPSQGAVDWKFFTLDGNAYLAVANHHSGSTTNLDSKLYRWNGSQFVEFQSIPTHAASDWEFFTIGGDAYLAVANGYNDSTYNLDSKLYRWNGTQFVEFQSIPTQGADEWVFFTIGSDAYLVVANNYDGSTYNLNSKLYRWNGTQFVEFQSIPTQGALDWEFFTIGSDAYLVVANHYNGATNNIDSIIYRWNEAQFVEFQAILTHDTPDWEFFTIGSDAYLIVANHYNGSTWNLDSQIYRANLVLGSVPQKPFVPLMRPQSIDLETMDPDLVAFHEGFTDDHYAYLVPNKFETSGKVARIDLQSFVTSTVTILNLAAVDSDLRGFYDGFTDGRYAYFVPFANASFSPFGKVARVDLQNFTTSGVTVLNLQAIDPDLKGFTVGFTDGRYAYFVPGFGINPTGKIARIDLYNFAAGGVTVLDLSLVDTDLKGMGGGFTDGRYAYFLGFAKVARVNLQNFTVAGVTTLDLSLIEPGLSGFYSVTDGRYAYLVPTYGSPQPGKLVRLDLQNFTFNGATTLDLTAVYSGLNSFGGTFIAGQYIYLVPHRYAPSATVAHGNLTRIDLQNFTVSGVTWIDMTATDPNLKGYQGGFTDGRYGYLVPGDYGGAVFHGKLVRFQLSDGINTP